MIKYNVSYFEEHKTGVVNKQVCFDDYKKAIEFANQISIYSDIRSICLETLDFSIVDTSVIKGR